MRIAFLGNFSEHSSETHHALSLEALGHSIARLQEGKATGEQVLDEALTSDLLVVVHTHGWRTGGLSLDKVLLCLKGAGIPTVTYHLDRWLGLQRQKDFEQDPFYRAIGWFFTVAAEQARWFNENTSVQGSYLPAAVYDRECYMATPGDRFDVCFAGSKGYHPEYSYRPRLVDWLAATYGPRFHHYGGGGLGTVRGAELNQVYADAKVVVGDSLCLDPNYAGRYWSDRIYETCGRGGFIIHPRLKGLEDTFVDGEHVVFYEHGDFDQLRDLIDYYLEDDEDRERIRKSGHEMVKSSQTYAHRWAEILETIA
jgi:hypothetical protein